MQSISLTTVIFMAAALVTPLGASRETELKDETPKTILKYVIEVPPGIAAAGTMDPSKQLA